MNRYNEWEKSKRVMLHEAFRNAPDLDMMEWRADSLIDTHKTFTALKRALEPQYSVMFHDEKKNILVVIKEPIENWEE